jgi:hypothetical protein
VSSRSQCDQGKEVEAFSNTEAVNADEYTPVLTNRYREDDPFVPDSIDWHHDNALCHIALA